MSECKAGSALQEFRTARRHANHISPWISLAFLVAATKLASAAPFVPSRDAHCVAISPDAKLVAIGISGQSNSEFPPRPHPNPRKSGVVQLFDVESHKRLRRMETFGDLTRVAFSPDGTLLAASRLFATDDGVELNEVRVWDVATGQVRLVFDRCHAFSFAPGRAEITVVSRKRCVTCDLAAGTKQRLISPLADALNIAYASDGATLFGIVHVSNSFVIRACASSTAEVRSESPPLPDAFYSLALSKATPALATGHRDGTVLVWDTASLQPTTRLRTGGTGRVFPFYSPNGEVLGAADQANSDVVFWETATGKELVRYTFKQGTLHTYGPKSEQRLIRPEEDPARFAFTPDGESFLGGPYGGILRLLNSGRDIARFGD